MKTVYYVHIYIIASGFFLVEKIIIKSSAKFDPGTLNA